MDIEKLLPHITTKKKNPALFRMNQVVRHEVKRLVDAGILCDGKELEEAKSELYRYTHGERGSEITRLKKEPASLKLKLSEAEKEKNTLANILDNIREKALTGHAHPDMTDIEMMAYNALQKLEWSKT